MSLVGDILIGGIVAAGTIVRGPRPSDQSVGQAAAASRLAARALLKTRLAVSLSGGGAAGFVGVAFLQHCSDEGLEFDAAAGISSGALVAGFYAWNPNKVGSSTSPHGLTRLLELRRAMVGAMSPGFVSLRPFRWWVEAVTGATALSSTTIPAYLGHTRLPTGLPGLATTGTLGVGVTAAGTFPGMYAPVNYQGSAVSDGAFTQVLMQPDRLRTLGYDFVFGLNAFPRGMPITGRSWWEQTIYDTLVRFCQPVRRQRDFQCSIQTMYGRVADNDAGFSGQFPGTLAGDDRSCEYHWIADPREYEATDFDEIGPLVDEARTFAAANLTGPNSPRERYKKLVLWRILTILGFPPTPKPAPLVVYAGPST